MKNTLQYILFLMIPGLIILNNNAFSQPDFFWQHPLPTGNSMQKIKFYDTQTGIAVGSLGTIMKTNNGGVNWFVQNSNTTADLSEVSFIDQNNIITVGVNTILRTSNGGLNWIQIGGVPNLV